jgi:hypothetical protein
MGTVSNTPNLFAVPQPSATYDPTAFFGGSAAAQQSEQASQQTGIGGGANPFVISNMPTSRMEVHPMAGQDAINRRDAMTYMPFWQGYNQNAQNDYEEQTRQWEALGKKGAAPVAPAAWFPTDYNEGVRALGAQRSGSSNFGEQFFPVEQAMGAQNPAMLASLDQNVWAKLGSQHTPQQMLQASPQFKQMQNAMQQGQAQQSSFQQFIQQLFGGGQGAGGTSQVPGAGTDNPTGSTSQFMANLGNDMEYLRQFAENTGLPISTLESFKAIKDSQERNVQQRAGQLNEYFNTMGGRFSTGFGDAMNDYWAQTAKDQNSLQAQMEMAALESGRNRQMQASGQLGQYAFQGPAMLEQMNFQDYMNQSNQGFQAAMYNAQATDQAQRDMMMNSNNAAMQMLNNSIGASQGLWGAENQATQQMYQNQMQQLQQMLGQDMQWQQMGMQGAGMLSNLWQQNLGLGNQLGQGQYNTQQDQINRAYQEWMRTSPMYHPYLPYLTQMAMGQQSMYFPQYTPSPFQQFMQLVGAVAPMMAGGGGG